MTYSSNEPHTLPSEPPRVPRMVSIALPNYKPVATMVLLVITVIIYLGQWLSQLAFNGADPLFELGGKINTLIEQGEVWRLITPAFLHASPIHLLFNMYALFVLGRVIEGVYGHSRFLMLYFISAFAGNVASFVLSANNSLGASTAIFGLIGAEAIFVIRNKRFFGNRFNATLTNIGVIIALNLAIGFWPGSSIDYWGHIGGLIGGTLFAFLAGPQWEVVGRAPAVTIADRQKGLNIILSGLLVAVVAAAAAIFMGGK
jgi:rhomboid protease GluP